MIKSWPSPKHNFQTQKLSIEDTVLTTVVRHKSQTYLALISLLLKLIVPIRQISKSDLSKEDKRAKNISIKVLQEDDNITSQAHFKFHCTGLNLACLNEEAIRAINKVIQEGVTCTENALSKRSFIINLAKNDLISFFIIIKVGIRSKLWDSPGNNALMQTNNIYI